MTQLAVKFENVSKMYRLGTIGTGTIGHDLHRWWVTTVRHRPDPYLQVGETNVRSQKGTSDYVYALKDIDLEVPEGEVLGIIGKNGAGKSTLLKLLSHVTAPSIGKIYTRGRIASLLEVGTGFHPELTGKENIYMNGAILGMKRWEIDKNLDAIVDFSGCERYLDTPVKRYSSGMLVRLGFAVAAYLEPEILVVDEVLSVGDAEFQKKAVGKIRDVTQNSGRTVFFVSHNMASVRALCTKGMLMEHGMVRLIDTPDAAIEAYMKTTLDIHTEQHYTPQEAPGNKQVRLRHAAIIDTDGNLLNTARIDQRVGIRVEYEVLNQCDPFYPAIEVTNSMGVLLFQSHLTHRVPPQPIAPGMYRTTLWLPPHLMQSGEALFGFACYRYAPYSTLFHKADVVKIEYLETLDSPTRNVDFCGTRLPGVVRPLVQWDPTTRL